jgi:hypothetical protein
MSDNTVLFKVLVRYRNGKNPDIVQADRTETVGEGIKLVAES